MVAAQLEHAEAVLLCHDAGLFLCDQARLEHLVRVVHQESLVAIIAGCYRPDTPRLLVVVVVHMHGVR